MPLQAVIIERVILSALITLVAAIASSPIGSSINGFSSLEKMTPLAELEGFWVDQAFSPADYTLTQIHPINAQD